jgi:biopolymer transport protein ExbB
MLELIEKGGVILIIIFVLALIAVVLIIERLLYLRKISTDESKLLGRLRSTLEKQHYDEAISICENSESPLANLIKVGIEYRSHDERTIKDVITDAANLEVPKLERFLSAIGTIAHIAPLLGLLGTVTGNIQAFGVLGRFGAIGDPAVLAKGISEALITTAAGIIVSIPTIIFYNSLVSRVNHLVIKLENRANELVLMLGKRRTAR